MKRAFFSFSEILSVGVIILAACVFGAHLFGALSVDGANCDTEGVWSMGTRTVGMTASATPPPWNGTAKTDWYDANPNATTFTITTPEQLAGLATLVNGGNSFATKTITLANDIDLGGNPNNWTPIGVYVTTNYSFFGTFDGGGHNISNLYINLPAITDVGLFGYIGGNAAIKNLNITSGSVTGKSSIGGVVGTALTWNGTIENCSNASNVAGSVGGGVAIGGIIGTLDPWSGSTGSITNCSNSGNISSPGSGSGDNVGGIAGSINFWSGTMSNCSNTGNISSVGPYSYAGGVVGGVNYHAGNGTITNCSNTGIVFGGGHSVGGVVGDVAGWTGFATVANCSNSGRVTGNGSVHGVVGSNGGTVANCEWFNPGGGNAVLDSSGVTLVTLANLKIVGVIVRPASFKIQPGGTLQLTETVHPVSADSGKKAVTWNSSAPSIATVDSGGLVTGVALGNATITVTTVTNTLSGGPGTATAVTGLKQPDPPVPPDPPAPAPIKEVNDKLAPSGVQVNILDPAAFPSVDARVEVVAPTILCYEPSGKPAGVVEVDISNAALYPDPNSVRLPMQYSLKLTESEISSRSNAVGRAVDTAKLFSHTGTPNESSIQEFFSVFVIQKEILQGARRGQLARLLGAGREEILTPQRAIAEGSLTMAVSSDRTVQIEFRYMVRDGDYSPYYDVTKKEIVIGDGLADRKIVDPMWASMRKLTDRESGIKIDGGSGCATASSVGAVWWLLMGVIPLMVRRRK